jgi:serine/threonine protein kinase
VHRDVKPGNVMLTTDGKVKVMDFGIARASAVPSITQTSAVVGTAQYIAPEQAQGMEADARSDVYSLGCCLYEMVTGQVPFTGPTPVAIAYRHIQEDPTPLRALNSAVPASLERVCLKAMAKRPEERYQTAAELQRDLDRVRAGEPVTAAMPRASQQTTRAMGAAGMGLADRPTTVLDRGVTPGRAFRYGAETAAPAAGGPRKGRAALFILGTIILAAIVAIVVVKAVQVPEVPSTTLPPISTLPPQPSGTEPPTTSVPSTTVPPTTAPPTTQAPTTTAPSTTNPQDQLVRVPDTRGMRVSQATNVLENAGFQVSRQNFPTTDRRQAFRVVEQVPRNGRAQRGSTVTIVVGVPVNNG